MICVHFRYYILFWWKAHNDSFKTCFSKFWTCPSGLGTWDLGLGTWDLTLDLGAKTWDLLVTCKTMTWSNIYPCISHYCTPGVLWHWRLSAETYIHKPFEMYLQTKYVLLTLSVCGCACQESLVLLMSTMVVWTLKWILLVLVMWSGVFPSRPNVELQGSMLLKTCR